MKKKEEISQLMWVLILCFLIAGNKAVFAEGNNSYTTTEKHNTDFTLSESGVSSPLVVSEKDYPGVIRVLKLFQTDLEKVTNAKPNLYINTIPDAKEIVILP